MADQSVRFADISVEDLRKLLDEKDSVNTRKATKGAVRVFQHYLSEKGLSDNLDEYTAETLNETLGKFYAGARTAKGELYKKTSIIAIRHGIARYFSSSNGLDIIKGPEFKESDKIFKAVMKDLKRQGKGGVDHHPPIDCDDLVKLYASFDLSRADHLQMKVFVDVMLHFGRRGQENLQDLKISDFAVTTDSQGLLYVYKVRDEQTKNHQEDSDTADGRMYQTKDDDNCPVKTFVRYKRMLNPKCSYLFQRPKQTPKDGTYFDNSRLGHNRLGNMMSLISKHANLSMIYTNHSLRATTVHVLDSARFPSRHIMSVTGHKSESSLKTYSGQTDCKTKKDMSHTLSQSLGLTALEIQHSSP